MVRPGRVQVFGFVKQEMKDRIRAVREKDHVIWSESRIVQRCLEKELPNIEKEAGVLFPDPAIRHPRRRKKDAA